MLYQIIQGSMLYTYIRLIAINYRSHHAFWWLLCVGKFFSLINIQRRTGCSKKSLRRHKRMRQREDAFAKIMNTAAVEQARESIKAEHKHSKMLCLVRPLLSRRVDRVWCIAKREKAAAVCSVPALHSLETYFRVQKKGSQYNIDVCICSMERVMARQCS